MNMFKPVDAKTTEEYMAMLPEERREILEVIDKVVKSEAPQFKEHFAYNMPGYGSFRYTNSKKEELDWPVISVASQKNYVSIYVCALEDGEYVAEKYKADLGKVSVGKSCIRFRKLEDLNMETFKKIVKIASKNPGLVYANDKKS